MNRPNLFVAHTLLRARDWQERQESQLIKDWWRDGGQGVCCLVGIGGAGKTALMDNFLRSIDGLLSQEAATIDKSLPSPDAAFVFSFYDSPSPDTFFESLYAWTNNLDSSKFGPVSTEMVFQSLAHGGRTLLVLDGVEKVQDDSLRGGILGRVHHAGLRDLFIRAAEGYMPNVSIIATPRFHFDDLSYYECPFQVALNIAELSEEACVSLMRRRGVNGRTLRLALIAVDCGHHALTVDLAASYISYFGGGDPDTILDLSPPRSNVLCSSSFRAFNQSTFWNRGRLARVPFSKPGSDATCGNPYNRNKSSM